jgi:hypothetical protein
VVIKNKNKEIRIHIKLHCWVYNNCSKWPPSAWIHILTHLWTEHVVCIISTELFCTPGAKCETAMYLVFPPVSGALDLSCALTDKNLGCRSQEIWVASVMDYRDQSINLWSDDQDKFSLHGWNRQVLHHEENADTAVFLKGAASNKSEHSAESVDNYHS